MMESKGGWSLHPLFLLEQIPIEAGMAISRSVLLSGGGELKLYISRFWAGRRLPVGRRREVFGIAAQARHPSPRSRAYGEALRAQ